MILRNIRVQGFGCFADEIEVGPFADGINLLYAPNGTGKSTLVKALTTALVDGYRVKCAELLEWKPWGRGLTPRIAVEFEHAHHGYRLEKRFLQGAASTLLRKEGGAWKQYMQNDDADEFVRKDILNSTPPGKGMANSEHWGLAQILWTTQGDLALPELAGNVVESIQRSVGATLTAAGSRIESRLEGLYAEFFTPARGTLKKTAPLAVMQREYDRLNAERALAEQELAEFDRKSTEIDDLRAQLASVQENLTALAVRRKATEERAERYRTLQSDRVQQAERKAARQAVYTNLKQQCDAIDATRERIAKTRTVLECAEASIPELDATVEAKTKACYRIKEQAAAASKAWQEANAGTVVAQVAREYLQTAGELETTANAAAEVAQLDLRIADLSSRKTALSAPSVQELATAKELADEEHQYELRLEMARVTVEIDPAKDASVRVAEGEVVGEIALHRGTVTAILGSPNVAFEVSGFGSIRVLGLVTDYATVKDHLQKCRAELRQFDDQFGTHGIKQLEEMHAEYCALEQGIKEALARRSGVLGRYDLKHLEARSAELSTRLAQIHESHPDWQAAPPNPDLLGASAHEALAAAEARVEATEKVCEQASAELTAADKKLSIAQTELTGLKEKLASLEAELGKLTRDGRTDADRRVALEVALIDYDSARAMLDRIDKELQELGDDPTARLALIEKDRHQLEDRIRTIETSIVQGETLMSKLAAQSPYQRFAELNEAVSLTSASLQTEGRRMEAIKLLHDVMEQTKADLLQSIAAPVEKTANQLLAGICGKPFGEIRLSSSFGASEVIPDALNSSNERVGIERLSGGEQEQLHLCTRLAVASELAKNERQLLVLDDVLTFTDHDRLARICDLLSGAAEKLQILILTCHPERFTAIEHVKPFDLEAVMRSRAGVGPAR